MPPNLPGQPKSSGNGRLYLLLGCGAALILGFLVVVAGGVFWFMNKRSDKSPGSSGSASSTSDGSANSLGLGACLSQYEHAAGSASVIGGDGTWHALFQDMPAYGKPVFIFHRASRDGGKTWSAPVNVSEDGTGNGSSYPRLGRDGQGNVFAAWIRFGQDGRVIDSSTLDGPGGYVQGTLMLRKWGGSQWEPTLTVGNLEKVLSFCFFNALDGSLKLLWVDEGGMIVQCPANGGDGLEVVPAGGIPCDNPTYNRPGNLAAVPDSQGGIILIAERKFENSQELVLWHAGKLHVVAADPKYETRNTFNYPAQIFADASGKIHVLYIPHPKLTEREQLWDLDPVTGQHTVVFSGRGGNDSISNFQLVADNGIAHVAVQWSVGKVADSTDVAAISFDGTKWSAPRGLTGASRAESFFHKDLPGGDVGVMTRYHAKHASMAIDARGKVHALVTMDALSSFSSGTHQTIGGQNYNVVSGATVSAPSVYVLPWE